MHDDAIINVTLTSSAWEVTKVVFMFQCQIVPFSTSLRKPEGSDLIRGCRQPRFSTSNQCTGRDADGEFAQALDHWPAQQVLSDS